MDRRRRRHIGYPLYAAGRREKSAALETTENNRETKRRWSMTSITEEHRVWSVWSIAHRTSAVVHIQKKQIKDQEKKKPGGPKIMYMYSRMRYSMHIYISKEILSFIFNQQLVSYLFLVHHRLSPLFLKTEIKKFEICQPVLRSRRDQVPTVAVCNPWFSDRFNGLLARKPPERGSVRNAPGDARTLDPNIWLEYGRSSRLIAFVLLNDWVPTVNGNMLSSWVEW